jgi:preprotein translocase subunit SecD
MIDVRDNLRIIALVVLCVLAGLALFGPLGSSASGENVGNQTQEFGDPTNLQYGLDLAGGTRIRGELVGQTAEVEYNTDRGSEIRSTIVSELQGEYNLEPGEVQLRPDANAIELYRSSEDVPPGEYAAALNAAGLDASESDISDGVTERSRTESLDVLNRRIDETGLGGSSVTTTQTPSGEYFIVVEVPGADRQQVEDLIGDTGRVQVLLGTPNGTQNATAPNTEVLLEQSDFLRIPGAVRGSPDDPTDPPRVRVQLTGGDDGTSLGRRHRTDASLRGQAAVQTDAGTTHSR